MTVETAPRAAQSEPAAEAPQPREKLILLDYYRGAAILAVLAIHLSGHFVASLHGTVWTITQVFYRFVLFAVPAFLLMSAFLNGRNLLRGTTIQQYVQNRVRKAVPPYLIWSVFGYIVAFHLSLDDLTNVKQFAYCLLWGKCYFHLYFLVIVLQLYVLLPLLRPFLVRRPPLWLMLLLGAALQAAIFWVNRRWHVFPYVGSVVMWHLPEITLGLWLAGQGDRFPTLVRRGFVPSLLIAGAAFVVYARLGVAVAANTPVNTAAYQAAEWLYTASASFALLGLCSRLTSPVLAWCGVHAMAIYLVHPFVIYFLDKTVMRHFPALSLGVAVPLYVAACIAGPVLFERLVTRASSTFPRLLFGS